MKISLVMCPLWNVEQPPLSTAYIAGQLKSAGHHVCSHDLSIDFILNLPEDERTTVTRRYLLEGWYDNFDYWRKKLSLDSFVNQWASEILAYKPDLIGFSIYDSTLTVSLLLAGAIKSISPETYIVFGGPACDEKEIILKGPIDFLVYGEGEGTITDLVERIQNNGSPEDCPGLVFVRKGDIVKTGPRPLIPDINEIPFPDFSDFDLKKYPLRHLPMFTSRGCPNRCTFCSESPRWGRYRNRTAENIILEMERNVNEFGITHFSMEDSTINGNIREFEKMCDLIISKELKVTWGGKARIHPKMNRNFLEKVYMAGCRGFIFGIESASQKVIDHMKKNVKISDVEKVIRHSHEAGIKVGCFFIVGYVNESEEDFEETLHFIKKNYKYIHTIYPGSGLFILKGSQLYEKAGELGVVFPEDSQSSEWFTTDRSNTGKVRSDRLARLNSLIAELMVKDREERIANLEGMVQERGGRIAGLEIAVQEHEVHAVNLGKMVQEKDDRIAGLEIAVQKHEVRVVNLGKMVQEKDERIAGLERRINKRENKISNLESIINKHEGYITDIEHTLQERNEHITSLGNIMFERESCVDDLDRLVREQERHISSLEAINQKKEEIISGLEKIIQNNNDSIISLEKERQESGILLSALAGKVQKSNSEMIDMEKELQEKENRIKDMGERIHEKEVRIADLESMLGEKDLRMTESDILRRERDSRISELEETVREKDISLFNLERIRASLENGVQEQEATLRKIFNSRGWKGLLLYYKIRDAIFPPNTRRQALVKSSLNGLINLAKKR